MKFEVEIRLKIKCFDVVKFFEHNVIFTQTDHTKETRKNVFFILIQVRFLVYVYCTNVHF